MGGGPPPDPPGWCEVLGLPPSLLEALGGAGLCLGPTRSPWTTLGLTPSPDGGINCAQTVKAKFVDDAGDRHPRGHPRPAEAPLALCWPPRASALNPAFHPQQISLLII